MVKELTLEEILAHSEMFTKQGTVYASLQAVDRAQVVTDLGLNTADPATVHRYIHDETLATGVLDLYLQCLQELLVVPPDRSTWTSIVDCTYIPTLCYTL